MAGTLTETDWTILLERIEGRKCTPFLGAGACHGFVELAGGIAEAWARQYGYPLADCTDLARVAQYLATTYDPIFPKTRILRDYIEPATEPDYSEADEPHGVLARLPLPIYITTNYDDFMVRALAAENKNPRREVCRWNSLISDLPSVFDDGFEPDPANPVVFHLHGHCNHDAEEDSIVLTEDDYLDFLVEASRDLARQPREARMIPKRIRRALSGTSLLFVGYGLRDWSFRVLYRGLVAPTERSLRRVSVTVQLLPDLMDTGPETRTSAEKYLERYFGTDDVRVYWGTARQFCNELRGRMG